MITVIRNELNTGMTIEECCKKHNLTFQQLWRLSLQNQTNHPQATSEPYIIFHLGSWVIRKKIHKKLVHFGAYHSKDDAKMVRDKLLECNWDITQVDSICDELGIERKKNNKCKRRKK